MMYSTISTVCFRRKILDDEQECRTADPNTSSDPSDELIARVLNLWAEIFRSAQTTAVTG
jgi:hypothetical protein